MKKCTCNPAKGTLCSKPKDCCCNQGQYPSHSSQISRLNRISGQIEGIKKMIHEQRYCLDILMQITAVRSALKSVEENILERHLNSCVMNAMQSDSEKCKKVAEIVELFKKTH